MSCTIIKNIRIKRDIDGSLAVKIKSASSNCFTVNGPVAYDEAYTKTFASKKSLWEYFERLCKKSGWHNGVYSAHDWWQNHQHWYYKNYTSKKSIFHMLASELMKIKGS